MLTIYYLGPTRSFFNAKRQEVILMAKNKTKKKTGNGKYQKWLQPRNLLVLERWARKLSNDQIAKNIGISPKTLYSWMNKYPEIKDAIEKGKEVVVAEIENALFKSAVGYWTEEITTDELGAEVKRVKKFVPPNPTSAIFALKNLDKDNWRDQQNINHSGENGGPIKINIVPDDGEDDD